MARKPRKLCLVTGASAGIGAALAREYARHGWALALTARRGDRLEALAQELSVHFGAESLVIPADLAEPGAPAQIVAEIESQDRQIDGLVNNAGFGLTGLYARTSWADQARFTQIMVSAPAAFAHHVLPGMISRGYGRILNIASLAGLVPGAKGHTLYAASKAFMIKASQSMRLEAQGAGVHVTALCPGFTYSEFHDANETRELVSQLPAWAWQTAEAVAKAGYEAVEANAAVRVTGLANKTIAALAKYLPDPAVMALMARVTGRIRRSD